jgi:hypothetical protein
MRAASQTWLWCWWPGMVEVSMPAGLANTTLHEFTAEMPHFQTGQAQVRMGIRCAEQLCPDPGSSPQISQTPTWMTATGMLSQSQQSIMRPVLYVPLGAMQTRQLEALTTVGKCVLPWMGAQSDRRRARRVTSICRVSNRFNGQDASGSISRPSQVLCSLFTFK